VVAVELTKEAAEEWADAPPSLRPQLMSATARLQEDPAAGSAFLDDPDFPFRRLDVTDGTSIIYCPREPNKVLITQIAQPHRLTAAVCLDEAERVKAALDTSDPVVEIVEQLSVIARTVAEEEAAAS
jgi:hypothetical protein